MPVRERTLLSGAAAPAQHQGHVLNQTAWSSLIGDALEPIRGMSVRDSRWRELTNRFVDIVRRGSIGRL